MTEFLTVKRIDNSRLVRHVAPGEWREFCRLAVAGALLAGFLLAYSGQYFQCLALRYQVEELKASRAEAAELNQELKLEDAALRAPGRIDVIARQQLGLTVPLPGQVSPASQMPGSMLAQARQSQTTAAQ
jgi:cell division protein FtsL